MPPSYLSCMINITLKNGRRIRMIDNIEYTPNKAEMCIRRAHRLEKGLTNPIYFHMGYREIFGINKLKNIEKISVEPVTITGID